MSDPHREAIGALATMAYANGAVAMKLAIAEWLNDRGLERLAQHVLAMPVPADPNTALPPREAAPAEPGASPT